MAGIGIAQPRGGDLGQRKRLRFNRKHQHNSNANGPPRGEARDTNGGQAGPSTQRAAKNSEDEPEEQDGHETRSHRNQEDMPVFERSILTLASNPLPPRQALAATLAKFINLHRLDMSYMQPTPAAADDDEGEEKVSRRTGSHSKGLETLHFLDEAERIARKEVRKQYEAAGSSKHVRKTLGETLTWLNLAGNTALGDSSYKGKKRSSDDVFRGLEHLKELFVLNISSSSLSVLPPRPTFLALSNNLRALVLSHNRLTDSSLNALPFLPNLNTLILSNNRITKLPRALSGNVPRLAKLSLSHNDLHMKADDEEEEGSSEDSARNEEDQDIQTTSAKRKVVLPDFTMNIALREVRLSHNARLSRLPLHLSRWGQGIPKSHNGLDLVDVGHCDLSWDAIAEALLRHDYSEQQQQDSAGAVTKDKEVSSGRMTSRGGGIKNLTLAGNRALEDEFEDGYAQRIQEALPGLVVLDNRRLVERKGKKEGKGPVYDGSKRANAGDHPSAKEAEDDGASKAEEGGPDRTSGKRRKRGSRGGSSVSGRTVNGVEDGTNDVAESEQPPGFAEVASDDEHQDGLSGKKSQRKLKTAKVVESFVLAPPSGKRGKRGSKAVPAEIRRGGEDAEDSNWLVHTRAAALSANTQDENTDGDERRSKTKGNGKSKDKNKGTDKSKDLVSEKQQQQYEQKEDKPKAAKSATSQQTAQSQEPAKRAERARSDIVVSRKAWDHIEESTEQSKKAETAGTGAAKQSAGVAGIVEVKKGSATKQCGAVRWQQRDKVTDAADGSRASESTPFSGATAAATSTPAALGQGIGQGEDIWGSGASAWN